MVEIDTDVTSEMPDPAGMVSEPVVDLPGGYKYGVTRYADLILREAFPGRFADIAKVLDEYELDASEILSGGGSRTKQTARFDAGLESCGWGKRNIVIEKRLDNKPIHRTRGHEIDMFAINTEADPYPGIAVEMEWNNKDPFYDRDLLNYQALHREGAIAVGVIITRGPVLQKYISSNVRTSEKSKSAKYGQSTTHWDKLVSRVNLGGGGECPLLLIGIEPERITRFDVIKDAYDEERIIWTMPDLHWSPPGVAVDTPEE